MEILITGATGFIGKDLVKLLVSKGHKLHVLSRNTQRAALTLSEKCEYHSWSSYEQKPDLSNIKKLDAVIHLAGETISKRWTWRQKKLINESRSIGTQNLIEALKEKKFKLKTFIGASAIGFYGNRKAEELAEDASKGTGFLSDVVSRWEDEVKKASEISNRLVHLRIGVVLAKDGGAFEKMIKPFKLGIGGKIGSGKQYLSWIHKYDLIAMISYILENDELTGAINATASYPVTNEAMTYQIINIMNKKLMPAVPKIVLRILLGEMSELVTIGQRVKPEKIRATDFYFKYPTIKETLYDLLAKT